MKRLIAGILAVSLVGSTAAMANSYSSYGGRYSGGYSTHNGESNGAGLAFGLLAFGALAALASQGNHYDRPYDRDYYSPAWRSGGYGHGNGYGGNYTRGYGNGGYQRHGGR